MDQGPEAMAVRGATSNQAGKSKVDNFTTKEGNDPTDWTSEVFLALDTPTLRTRPGWPMNDLIEH